MAEQKTFLSSWQERLTALRNTPPVLKIVWQSGPGVVIFGLLSRLFAALLPLALLWVPKLIVDAIVHAKVADQAVSPRLWWLVGLEFGLAVVGGILARAIDYSDSLIGAVAEISLDRPSGRIKVHNFWCAIDCGRAVQPDNVIAQTESSIVYGLGMALTEMITVEDGAIQQSNFYDYEVMRMRDVPEMHIEVMSTDNPPTGAGQMATPVVAPAINNAFAALAGVRLRETPMTPERVKRALG